MLMEAYSGRAEERLEDCGWVKRKEAFCYYIGLVCGFSEGFAVGHNLSVYEVWKGWISIYENEN